MRNFARAEIPVAVLRQTRVGPGDVAPAVRAFIASNQIGNIVGLLIAPALIRSMSIAGVTGICAALTGCVGLYMLLRTRR
jgi:hypothetical protein